MKFWAFGMRRLNIATFAGSLFLIGQLPAMAGDLPVPASWHRIGIYSMIGDVIETNSSAGNIEKHDISSWGIDGMVAQLAAQILKSRVELVPISLDPDWVANTEYSDKRDIAHVGSVPD